MFSKNSAYSKTVRNSVYWDHPFNPYKKILSIYKDGANFIDVEGRVMSCHFLWHTTFYRISGEDNPTLSRGLNWHFSLSNTTIEGEKKRSALQDSIAALHLLEKMYNKYNIQSFEVTHFAEKL